ncbi:sigma-70 family RNA polymerase sigma factor [Leucobacter viscericola]|uniref:Sigma-70 family RNA polymerase sigma factor n=1 Tax=Leucobacter viscericola TaxID=2714935 RepID=A0A6G7XH16_9MICO|nr:sigma-70 family RNA polymerase sigma factor [Leucobacter viscericola]QIK63766.1 sigma-70 family RNA polymerase sigma factor [Leucobacter viscericola]
MNIQSGKTQSTLASKRLDDPSSDFDAPNFAAQNTVVNAALTSAGAALNDLSDEELLDLSRRGNRAAYTVIWTRHSASGLKSARYFSNELDAHDLVAEAYSRIYIAITRGGGPRTAFRTYLQVTIRNIANKWRNEHRSLIDLELAEQNRLVDVVEDDVDSRADRSMMRQAFASLPTTWQEVLWYTEVLELKPQSVASKLKMTANNVSVLSFRARDGLRKAWIRAHLGEANLPKECADTIDRLPAYILGSQTSKRSQKITDHLSTCERCTRIRDEADVAASRLHTVVLPLVLTGGIGAATLGALAGAPSSASATSLGTAGTAKTTVLGGSKLALIAGASVLTIGAIITVAVWSGGAQQSTSSSPDSPGTTALEDVKKSEAEGEQPAAAAEAVGRDDWSTRPGEAETASLYSVPVVSAVDAPQFSFSEDSVFATPIPLLTGYAAPGATVALFISAEGGSGGDGYERLTAQATPPDRGQ